MSILEHKNNTTTKVQELVYPLLNPSIKENSCGPSAIHLVNDLGSLNISKIQESINTNSNSQEPLTFNPKENFLNFKHFISKDSFLEAPSPTNESFKNQNSESLNTADFNKVEFDYSRTESKLTNNGSNKIAEISDNMLNDIGNDFNNEAKEIEKNNFKTCGSNFEDYNSNVEMSFGRFSLMPKYRDETIDKILEFDNIDEICEKSQIFQINTEINKKNIYDNIFNENNNYKMDSEIKTKEKQTKCALDLINSFQMGNMIQSPSPNKPFSINFLNEMKNIPISEINKINPYSYINVFSTPKSPEIKNNKIVADEGKQPVLTKKNSNENEENRNKNLSSPNKTKKIAVVSPNLAQTNPKPAAISPPNLQSKPLIISNISTLTQLNKKKDNPPPLPKQKFHKKQMNSSKEKTGLKSNIIKEVNEDSHSNEDSKSIKDKHVISNGNAHKNSADLEKFPNKLKDTQLDEENKKSNLTMQSTKSTNQELINEDENKKLLCKNENNKTSANINMKCQIDSVEMELEENKKSQIPIKKSFQNPNNSKISIDEKKNITKFNNEMKMELPETEMEENLKFLMEKADRTNPVGETMFQTLNSLLKYKQHLEIKEKNLNEKEKFFVEFEQKSKSSTQWSYDTKSTLNGTDPIKTLLEEFYKEKKNDFFQYEPPSEADIHFLFLYSSPLITYFRDKEGKIGKRPIYNEIGIVNEWKTLQEILPESKREIKFMKSSASLEKIGVIFDRNPMAIHFCGHGVKNNEENFGLVSNEEVGDFLIFEDQYGGADFVSCMTLSKFLNKLKNKLHFAFVASCHSKLVGEVFLNAGALHVICVKREETILDKACQIFTKAFYNACFTGKKTICEAFEIAKEQIRANANLPKGEENKFVMLIKRPNNQSIYDEHKCMGMIDLGPGSFQDLSPKPEFNHLPSHVENFVGRNEMMHEVISFILNNRFITITGIPGIGKSSLAKEVARYIYDRNYFKNGVIFLQLISCQTNEAVTSCLDSKVFPNSSFKQIESKKENTLKMLYQIIDNLRNKEVLIIMDNIDMVLANFSEKEKFQSSLDYLLSSCNNLKLLITSRTPVGGVSLADCIERLYNLSHLNNEDAKNLFLLRSPRPISSQEISDLLLLIPNENIDENIKPKESTFSGHQFMELFGGHPQAITLGAALLYERSLKDLYNYLKSNSIVNVLHLDPYLSEREKKTFNSLKASLDASWKILYEKNKIAAKFFSVMGLLPGGASEEEFHAIWGGNWQEFCDVLLRSSLLIKTQKNDLAFFSLFPFMTKYAEEHIRIKDKREFHQKIMEYYHKKIQKIFKMIGTLSNESSKAVDDLQDVEFNIRACIFRELSFHGSKELEQSLYENYSNLNVTNSLSIDNLKNKVEPSNKTTNPNNNNENMNVDDDFVYLTKENLEIHKKKYEFITNSKLLSNQTSKKSQRSTSPICINENLANYLKSPSKNNDDDESDKKNGIHNDDSNKGGTVSVSNDENTKFSAKEIVEPDEKGMKKSRPAIVPDYENNDSYKNIGKKPRKNVNDNVSEENDSKSESNTPKFSKKIDQNMSFEEIVLEKNNENCLNQKNNENILIEKNNENTHVKNNENVIEKPNENIITEKYNENINITLEKKSNENFLMEKDIIVDKNNYDTMILGKNNENLIEKTNNEILILETAKNGVILNIKTEETEKNISKKPTNPKDKKLVPPTNKNSLSSTARPSTSLTNPENQPKLSKTNIKPSTTTKPKIVTKFPNSQFSQNKTKVSLINKILIYYSSTLFLLRRYNECNKMITHGLQLSEKMNDKLAYANFKRISGSVQYIKKNFQQALFEFTEAEDLYKEIGCSLGICISEAAIGYVKYLEGEYTQAKNYLESALKIYDSLNHVFGIHFMNRWLANVKRKIPGFGTQTKKHIEAAQKIIRNKNKLAGTKNNEKTNLSSLSKHKGGYFILRWMGDGISIFIEAAFKMDIEGKKSKLKSSLINIRNSGIPPQISASEDMVFKNELQIPSLVKSESQKKSQTNKPKNSKEEEKIEKKDEKNLISNRLAIMKKKK